MKSTFLKVLPITLLGVALVATAFSVSDSISSVKADETSATEKTATSLRVSDYSNSVDQGKTYTFDGKVFVNYSDQSSEEITEGYSVSALDTSGHGPKELTVSYAELSTTITINVIQTVTNLDPVALTAIISGSVIVLYIVSICVYSLVKSFKI